MDGIIFIGAAIIAVTEIIKRLVPQVNGAVTIVTAGLVGIVVALLDVHIGIVDMTVAEGLMAGLSASGAVTVATAVSTTAPPKSPLHG